jgi:UDP-N-acetylmuramoyl-tripeptide--D-alanyl-D-alanine ligase
MQGQHFPDVEALKAAVLAALDGVESVLVKGSRFMKMERVADALAGAIRQTPGAGGDHAA